MTIGQKKNYLWVSVVSVILFLCFWYLVTAVLKMFPGTTLPSPVVVFRAFVRKMTATAPDGATLPAHIGSSLKIAMSGYFLAVIIGTPLGIAMAWYKKADLFVRPLFDLIRPVPGIAWIP
jgi:NitT/TauT family transport system permease protein/taurine transport system permease protein